MSEPIIFFVSLAFCILGALLTIWVVESLKRRKKKWYNLAAQSVQIKIPAPDDLIDSLRYALESKGCKEPLNSVQIKRQAARADHLHELNTKLQEKIKRLTEQLKQYEDKNETNGPA